MREALAERLQRNRDRIGGILASHEHRQRNISHRTEARHLEHVRLAELTDGGLATVLRVRCRERPRRDEAWGVEKPPLQHPGENSTRWHIAQSPPQRGTILLADDDVSVRQMLGRILESEHYTVLRAKTAGRNRIEYAGGDGELSVPTNL